jgi:peptidoglycan/xylan/chitin deacetylase (PgdA/CDA1 family)
VNRVRRLASGRAVDALSLAMRTRPAGLLVSALDELARWPPDRLAVLTYHRIDEPERRRDLDPALISATPAEFERQIRLISEQFRPLAAEELLAVRAGRDRLPPRAVLVTFDDGYADFLAHAWPVLRRYRVPVTLFVTTDGRDDPASRYWWDRLHASLSATNRADLPASPIGPISLSSAAERRAVGGRLRAHLKGLPHEVAMDALEELLVDLGAAEPSGSPALLGWPDLRTLSAEGAAIAPHTRTHPVLTGVEPGRLVDEIDGSLGDLEASLGSVTPLFAYPAGGHDGRVAAAVERAGVRAAFTTVRGSNDFRRPDWYRLRRINVARRTRGPLLHAQLLATTFRLQELLARR